MADDVTRDNSRPGGRRTANGLDRLFAARWPLAAFLLFMAWTVLAGRLSLLEALAATLVIGAVIALAPRRGRRARDQALARANHVGVRDMALAQVTGALDLPAIVLDNRVSVRNVNATARRWFPRLEEGQPLALTLRQPALIAAVEACRDTGEQRTIDLQLTVPNAAWFRVTVSPVVDERAGEMARPDRMLVILLDTTEQKRIDTMRSDFIANVSHELRTPLTSLTGFIETLQGPAANDADARTRFLDIMRNQAERMAHLISDLLSLSRIEQRQHMQPTGSVDLVSLVRQVAEGLAPQARAAGVSIDLDLDPGPARVTGDRDELYEVVENLVDNAINYGAAGGSIDIALKTISGRPGYAWQLLVADHGEGIPEEHVPRLTERFYRVNPESSREKKGTGLGLAIVKHIVSRHRGLLTIRSRLGEGTRIEILLPA